MNKKTAIIGGVTCAVSFLIAYGYYRRQSTKQNKRILTKETVVQILKDLNKCFMEKFVQISEIVGNFQYQKHGKMSIQQIKEYLLNNEESPIVKSLHDAEEYVYN